MRSWGICPTRLISIMSRTGDTARHHQRRSHQPDGRQPLTRYAPPGQIKLPFPARLGRSRIPQQLIAEMPKSHRSGSSPSQEGAGQMMDMEAEKDPWCSRRMTNLT